MGIRRRFSSLSGNGPAPAAASRAKNVVSSSACSAANSASSLLMANSQAQRIGGVCGDENGNGNNNRVSGPIGLSEDFDLATNLEAYKQRCKALEAENRRLMANQGRIIQDSNRRMDSHLEEIRQLKEAMERQQRDHVELVRWAQTLEADCSKAKELAKEWQKVGQLNNRLIQRELESFHSKVDKLELKCANLTAENVELKRLCLYLDKQRQQLWQQLAAKGEGNNETEAHGQQAVVVGQEVQGAEECCSEDAGCGSSAPSSPSSSNSLNSLEAKAGGGGGLLGSQIQVDGEQEKTLQSICSEMHTSTALGQSMEGEQEEPEVTRRRQIVSPKILDAGGGEPFEQAQLKSMPLADQSMNKSAMSENGTSSSSSSFGTTAQFGSSFCSSSDDTAILVLDMDDQSALLHSFDSLSIDPLHGLAGGLEVRELCTISEEEGDDGAEDGAKLVKAQLDRLKFGEKPREAGMEESKELVEELVRRRMGTSVVGIAGTSLCSSLLAQAGSMLTSMVEEQQQQQMSRSAFVLAVEKEGDGANRNSSASTGSSSSSGAFSGTSGSSNGEGLRRVAELVGEDDLPPEMPLISENHRHFPPSSSLGRPSSCLGAIPKPIPLPTQQSSTLPRAAAAILPIDGLQSRSNSVIGQSARPINPPDYSSLNSSRRSSPRPQKKLMLVNGQAEQLGRQSKAPPVRIRVRPPFVAQQPALPRTNGSKESSLDQPKPMSLHFSTSKVKGHDVTAL